MRPYPQFWLVAALLATAGAVASYWNLPILFFSAFPDPMTRAVCLAVFALFLWVFFYLGEAAARDLEENGAALAVFMDGGHMQSGAAAELLHEASQLRARGLEAGQSDFALLHEKTDEKFASFITRGTQHIEAVLLFLFFVGMFFTVVGIVAGFAFTKPPTGPEEAKLMSLSIIRGLGLAYAISGSCLGSALILYVLNSLLKAHARAVQTIFSDALYEVAILGTPAARAIAPSFSREETPHALKTN